MYYLVTFEIEIPDNSGGDGEHEGQEPDQDGHLLGLGRGAQVLGLHGVHNRVVSKGGNMVKSANIHWMNVEHPHRLSEG